MPNIPEDKASPVSEEILDLLLVAPELFPNIRQATDIEQEAAELALRASVKRKSKFEWMR